MVLVNGGFGIGTGYSCSVPNFSPRDIVENIRRYLRGEEFAALKPWYRGFTGSVEASGTGFVCEGCLQVVDKERVRITELPVGKWTQSYKDYLARLQHAGDIGRILES